MKSIFASMIWTASSPRGQKLVAWLNIIGAVILTAGGLFGVWLQGLFYDLGPPSGLTVGELRAAFILPTAVTTMGSLLVAVEILVGPLTKSWTHKRRLIALFCFAIFVLMICFICGHLAGSQIPEHFEPMYADPNNRCRTE